MNSSDKTSSDSDSNDSDLKISEEKNINKSNETNDSNQIQDKDQKEKPQVKKRVRTGCLNCRRKHKKCDETKPICTTCSAKNETCEWPNPKSKNSKTNLLNYDNNNITNQIPPFTHSFHHTQLLGPIPSMNHFSLSSSEFKRPRLEGPTRMIPTPILSQVHNIQDSVVPTSSNTQDTQHQQQSQTQPTQQQQQQQQQQQNYSNWKTSTTAAIQNILNSRPTIIQQQPSSKSKRSEYILTNSQSFLEFQSILTKYLIKYEVPIIIPYSTISPNLSDEEEVLLFKHYITKISPQLDFMHVDGNIFRNIVPVLSRHSKALKYAIFALSLVYWERSSQEPYNFKEDPLKLFQIAVAQFINNSASYSNSIRVATALLLVLFCISVTDQSGWRELVKGLTSFLKSEDIRPIQRELVNFSVFWNVAVLDIVTTDLMKEKTLMTYDFESLRKFSLVPQIIGYLSMTFNVLVLDGPQETFDQDWERIWIKIFKWGEQIEEEHLEFIKEIENSPFPDILCHSSPSVMINQLYALTKILLLQDRPRLFRNRYQDDHSLAWYAKRIAGINKGNPESQIWIITPLCLSIAGKVLTHDDEHKEILQLLAIIENKFGPINKYKSSDLINFWEGKTNIA